MSSYPWPEPERSTGSRCGSIDPLGRYKCWQLKDQSPAFYVWKAVSKAVKDLLEDQFEYLDARGSDIMFEMFMIGRKAAKSSPTILFSCGNKAPRQKAMELVLKSSILACHRGVLMAECSRLPRLLTLENEFNTTALPPGVYINGPTESCGLSVLVSGDHGGLPRKATIGGFIIVGDDFYGLTTAHGFSEMEETAGDTEEDLEFAFYGMGTSDDSSSDEDEFLEMTSKGSISSGSSLSDTIDEQSTPSRSLPCLDQIHNPKTAVISNSYESDEISQPNNPTRFGTLHTLNSGCLDWALVDIEHSGLQIAISMYKKAIDRSKLVGKWRSTSNFGQVFSSGILLNQIGIGQNDFVEEVAVNAMDVDVFVCAGSNPEPLKGRLSSNSSFTKYPGNTNFQELWTVTLENGCQFVDGNCGSWVVDCRSHNLYGCVISGYPGTGTAYIIPFSQVLEDIQKNLQRPVKLPVKPLSSTECSIDQESPHESKSSTKKGPKEEVRRKKSDSQIHNRLQGPTITPSDSSMLPDVDDTTGYQTGPPLSRSAWYNAGLPYSIPQVAYDYSIGTAQYERLSALPIPVPNSTERSKPVSRPMSVYSMRDIHHRRLRVSIGHDGSYESDSGYGSHDSASDRVPILHRPGSIHTEGRRVMPPPPALRRRASDTTFEVPAAAGPAPAPTTYGLPVPFGRIHTQFVGGNYRIEPASNGRRRQSYYGQSPFYGSSYENQTSEAQAYQEFVEGYPVALTAEAVQRAFNARSRDQASVSRSTRTSSSRLSRADSDYARSSTTRTSWSGIDASDENVTMKVGGSTKITVGGALLELGEDGGRNVVTRNESTSRDYYKRRSRIDDWSRRFARSPSPSIQPQDGRHRLSSSGDITQMPEESSRLRRPKSTPDLASSNTLSVAHVGVVEEQQNPSYSAASDSVSYPTPRKGKEVERQVHLSASSYHSVFSDTPSSTLYMSNIPADESEDTLKEKLSTQPGYKRLFFRATQGVSVCLVEFDDIPSATSAMKDLRNPTLESEAANWIVVKGIRLSFSQISPAEQNEPLNPVAANVAATGSGESEAPSTVPVAVETDLDAGDPTVSSIERPAHDAGLLLSTSSEE